MKKIGEEMKKHGYDLEYHHCASDHQSLDGLVIPALGVAIMDGTFPHTVDPSYPGAVDEIINFGQFWDGEALRKNKEKIIKFAAEAGRLFKQAYRFLATAKIYRDARESYDNPDNAGPKEAWDKLALQITAEVISGKNSGQLFSRVRRLFASAISPEGTIDFLGSLIEGLEKVFIIQGGNGAAKSNLLAKVADAALMRGFYIEAYHCALDPHRIDHLIIPESGMAIINSMEPHCLKCPATGTNILTGGFFAELPQPLEEEKQLFHRCHRAALDEAIGFLAKAKSKRDELEKLYMPHVNFAGIDQLRNDITESLLERGEIKSPYF